jgi:lactate dehydrogenase-like 2-hydroxyacid dehydrogenase
MSKLAVIADVHLLPETQQQINQLTGSTLTFPAQDTQPSFEELVERTADADAVLVSPGTKVTEEYLVACPSVKYIGICGTSKENVDLEALSKRNITITNVVDYGDEPAAEFIFMQLETLARGMSKYQWRDYPTELMGKTIGIIGLGALGKAIANLALAYKMKVYYYSNTRKPEQEQLGVTYADKAELLKTCHIIIISTPSNLVALAKDDFVHIQPNAVIVQASMGKCLDQEAFLGWIEQDGNFAMFDYSAGNESYEAYKELPRVIFPKVVAGHTHETKQRLGDKVISNLKEYLEAGI